MELPANPERQPRSRQVRLSAGARRELILTAAQELFGKRPYATVSIGDIANLANTTRTNVFHHFESKRALYLEVVRMIGHMRFLSEDGDAIVTGDRELNRLIGRWLDTLEASPETIMTLIDRSTWAVDPEIAIVFQGGAQQWVDRLLVVLEMPDMPANRALLRAFQGMAGDALTEWLHRGTLDKSQIHKLLTSTLRTIASEFVR